MTTIVQLLAQKQKLIERLDEIPDPKERAQIERLFAEIDEDLNLLDAEPGGHLRLTEQREIAPYVWVHPDDNR